MSYGYQPAPRKSGMTTAGKWMFIIGLVLAVIAGAAAAWGLSRTVGWATDMESESVSLAGGPQTVAMEQGDTRLVISEGSSASGISCTVTLPDGTETSLSTADSAEQDAMAQADATLVGAHSATATGDHVFACEGGNAMLTPAFNAGQIGAVVAMGIGLVALLPAGLLALIGLILWLVGRGKDRRALQQPVGPGGYGGGQGYAGQGYGGQGYGQGYGGDSSGYGRTEDYPRPGQQSQPGYGSQPGQGSGSTPPPPYGQPGQNPPPPPSGYGQPGGPTSNDPYASPGDDGGRDDEGRPRS